MRDWPRHEVRSFSVDRVRLDVYRRDDRLGKGNCMSLYVDDDEIMRFDLFTPAHEHWNLGSATRQMYPSLSYRDRVTLATNNLRHAKYVLELRGSDYTMPDLGEARKWAKRELS